MKKVQSPLVAYGSRVASQLCWLVTESGSVTWNQADPVWIVPVIQGLPLDDTRRNMDFCLRRLLPNPEIVILHSTEGLALTGTFVTCGQAIQISCKCTGTYLEPTITVEAKFL